MNPIKLCLTPLCADAEALAQALGDGGKKNPPFLEAGCCIISFLIYYHAPPPAEVIIMSTTIIIMAAFVMTLLKIFFNMKDVCLVNIHPPG